MTVRNFISLSWIHIFFSSALSGLAFLFSSYFQIGSSIKLPIILGIALVVYILVRNKHVYTHWRETQGLWKTLIHRTNHFIRLILETPWRKTSSICEVSDVRRRLVYRQISFLLAQVATFKKTNCRQYQQYLSKREIELVQRMSNKPYSILKLQRSDLDTMRANHIINEPTFILLSDQVLKFIYTMDTFEYNANTLPKEFYIEEKMYTWLLIVLVTISTSELLQEWSMLLGIFIGYIFLTLQTLGKALLNPFDKRLDLLNIDKTVKEIEATSIELLKEREIADLMKDDSS